MNEYIDKILKVFVVAICAISNISCTKESTSFFPLDKGYKWRYDVAVITLDGLEQQQYIFNNLGQVKLDGKKVYLRKTLAGTVLYYQNQDDGIYYIGKGNNSNLKPVLIEEKQMLMPKPVSTDGKWALSTLTKLLKKTGPPQKTEFRIEAEVPLEVRIESLKETVGVPAGQFANCMKVVMSGSTFKDAGNYVGLTLVNVEQTNWYAPGVGLVKMERIETTKAKSLDRGTMLMELVEFEKG